MYVWLLVAMFDSFANGMNATHEKKMEQLEMDCRMLSTQFRDMRFEIESLRFTMFLWSYVNIGLIIILVYSSWRTYKRQEKMTEWRV